MKLEEIQTRMQSARDLLGRLDDAELRGDDPAEVAALAAELQFQLDCLQRELRVMGVL